MESLRHLHRIDPMIRPSSFSRWGLTIRNDINRSVGINGSESEEDAKFLMKRGSAGEKLAVKMDVNFFRDLHHFGYVTINQRE